jgi:hypothetical protein
VKSRPPVVINLIDVRVVNETPIYQAFVYVLLVCAHHEQSLVCFETNCLIHWVASLQDRIKFENSITVEVITQQLEQVFALVFMAHCNFRHYFVPNHFTVCCSSFARTRFRLGAWPLLRALSLIKFRLRRVAWFQSLSLVAQQWVVVITNITVQCFGEVWLRLGMLWRMRVDHK